MVCFGLIISLCIKNPVESKIADNNNNQQSGVTEVKSTVTRDLNPAYNQNDFKQLVTGNSKFAYSMYKAISQKEQGNIFFSPYSISVALAMAIAGAKGTTEEEIQKTLCFPFLQETLLKTFNGIDLMVTMNNGESVLKIANSIWENIDRPVLSSYSDMLSLHYNTSLNIVDFSKSEESRILINSWVSDKTENKIKDLLPSGLITPLTSVVLCNAVYFYSQWLYCFNKNHTRDEAFTLMDGSVVSVPLMSLNEKESDSTIEVNYTNSNKCEAVELFYKNNKFSMVFILPYNNTFTEFESSLSNEKVNTIINSLTKRRLGNVKIPKFQFTSSVIPLKEMLSNMGMSTPFSGAADFSRMTSECLFIGNVYHQSFISVDENGTEAAAATAVVFCKISDPLVTVTFNRPFIFLIRDIKSESILFLGRVMNPKG